MSDFPDAWRTASLADWGVSLRPGFPSGRHHREALGILHLRPMNITRDGNIDLADAKFVTDDSDRRVQSGDVLFNNTNSPALVGKTAFVGLDGDFAYSNHMTRLRPPPQLLDGRFLARQVHWRWSNGYFESICSNHVNQASVSSKRLSQVVVGAPAVSEQRRIVDLLEEHLSSLDAAGDYLTASALRLGGLREVTVRQALTGDDDPSPRWQPDLPAVGTHDGDLVPLPLGWRWTRLGDVADIAGGVTKDTQRQSDPTLPEVPYLRVANVQRGRLDLTTVAMIRVPPAKAMALTLRPGDVLLNEGGDRDKLARGWVWEGQIEGCIHQNHVFRARLQDDRLDPYFLAWTTNSFGGRWAERNGKQSVNLASISLSKIRQMPVIVPPPGVAARVAARLADDMAALDRIERGIRTAQSRQSLLAKSLFSAAFSGRLTGRSSDSELVEELADQEAS